MNRGQQTGALESTVSIISSLDEATREKVFAELPEELKRRLVAEQQAASLLAAARLNLNADSVQQMLASGFLNIPTSEIGVGHNSINGHTINIFKAPGAGLAHSILKTSAVAASHNTGVRTAGGSHNHGTPTVHHITTNLPGAGRINNMSSNPAQMNGTNAHGVIGSHSPGVRASGPSHSQSVDPRSLGMGVSLCFDSKGPGASTSHSFNPRAVMAHNAGSMSAARQLGAVSPVNMQMGHLPGNSIHLSSSHRCSTLPGSFPAGINGQLLRHKPIISTYLDDFKQGFPSKGLSAVSNRWWGSAEPDKTPEMLRNTGDSSLGGCQTDASGCMDYNTGHPGPSLSIIKGKDTDVNEVLNSCRNVTRSRRRAAASSKRALQLGVAKGYGVPKLGKKEAAVLQFAFGDSLPRKWWARLPDSG